nr:hypothetical protein [Melghirimyces profundicolus]
MEGRRWDFTASQFAEPIHYQDLSSDRAEAFADPDHRQYRYLKEAVIIGIQNESDWGKLKSSWKEKAGGDEG